MMWYDDRYGHGAGWEGWVMFVFMMVFVVAVIIAIVYLVRYLGQPPRGPQVQQGAPYWQGLPPAAARETPQEILQRRYAAGEIDREEYQQKLADLSSGP